MYVCISEFDVLAQYIHITLDCTSFCVKINFKIIQSTVEVFYKLKIKKY